MTPTSLVILLIFIIVSCSSAADDENKESILSSPKRGREFDDSQFWIDYNFPIVAASSSSADISSQCVYDTKAQLEAIHNGLPWAVQMYESSGSLTDKLIASGTGNVRHEMGLFDECLAAVGSPSFEAKYCTVFFDYSNQTMLVSNSGGQSITKQGRLVENMSNFVKPSIAFCIPSSCTADDLRSAVANRISNRRHLSFLSPSTSEDFCHTQSKIKDDTIFTMGAIISCCAVGLLILLAFVATIHESFVKSSTNNNKIIIDILHCFSVRKNSQAILSTKVNDKDNLSCLHGIRFICMLLLIAYHSQFKFSSNIYNFGTAMKTASRWDAQFLSNGSIFVEAFFLMSGLLVCLSLMRQLDRSKGSFNVLRYYLHRYIRLTPLYAVVIALVAFVLPLMATGPDWHYFKKMAEAVRRLWWSQLLYINNYVPKFDVGWGSPQSGMVETWYLACDMQMYWLSPLFIYPLWRWKKAGIVWVTVCLFAFLGTSTIPFIQNPDLLPTLLVLRPTRESVEIMGKQWDHFYTQTYCRLPPYIIGILLGYHLHKTKGQQSTTNAQLNKLAVLAGWIAAVVTAFVAIHGMAPFFNQDSFYVATLDFSPLMRIGYGAFHRSAFTLALAWIIYACTRQYGGLINKGLSWKMFMPLGRLCYAAYLINFNLIKMSISSQRNPTYMSESEIFLIFLGFLFVTFTLSFVASLIVEMPFLNLDKLLLVDHSPAAPAAIYKPAAAADKEENNNNNHEVDMKQENGAKFLKTLNKTFFSTDK